MKLGTVRKITKENLARLGELPEWMDALLSPLNEFLEKSSKAIEGRLTFKDNMLQRTIEQKINTGIEFEVSIPATNRAIGIQVLEVRERVITGYGFTRKTNGNIAITVNYTPVGEAVCRLMIHLE